MASIIAVLGGGTVGFLAAGPAGAIVGSIVGALVTSGGTSSPAPTPPAPAIGDTTTPTTDTTTPPTDEASAKSVVIGSGDYPGTLAAKYAGDSKRWKELTTVNPGLTIVFSCKTTGADGGTRTEWLTSCASPGVIVDEGLSPWVVGQTVTLPASWTSG